VLIPVGRALKAFTGQALTLIEELWYESVFYEEKVSLNSNKEEKKL